MKHTSALELTAQEKFWQGRNSSAAIDLKHRLMAERHARESANPGPVNRHCSTEITARVCAVGLERSTPWEDLAGLEPYQINRKGLSRSFQITHLSRR